jgi:hypothetical protein
LVLACKGKAFNIVAGTKNKDAHAAWIRIRDAMAPNKVKDLIQLNKKSTSLKKKDNSEDPELYITELEKINDQYESVGALHKKEDVDMIVQIFLILPETYVNCITSRETIGTEDVTLEEVKTKLSAYWDRWIKKKTKNETTNQAILVDNQARGKSQHYRKQLKGICGNCGKQGHKTVDCWGKKSNGNPNGNYNN